jgi:hypothetical protein
VNKSKIDSQTFEFFFGKEEKVNGLADKAEDRWQQIPFWLLYVVARQPATPPTSIGLLSRIAHQQPASLTFQGSSKSHDLDIRDDAGAIFDVEDFLERWIPLPLSNECNATTHSILGEIQS